MAHSATAPRGRPPFKLPYFDWVADRTSDAPTAAKYMQVPWFLTPTIALLTLTGVISHLRRWGLRAAQLFRPPLQRELSLPSSCQSAPKNLRRPTDFLPSSSIGLPDVHLFSLHLATSQALGNVLSHIVYCSLPGKRMSPEDLDEFAEPEHHQRRHMPPAVDPFVSLGDVKRVAIGENFDLASSCSKAGIVRVAGQMAPRGVCL